MNEEMWHGIQYTVADPLVQSFIRFVGANYTW